MQVGGSLFGCRAYCTLLAAFACRLKQLVVHVEAPGFLAGAFLGV